MGQENRINLNYVRSRDYYVEPNKPLGTFSTFIFRDLLCRLSELKHYSNSENSLG